MSLWVYKNGKVSVSGWPPCIRLFGIPHLHAGVPISYSEVYMAIRPALTLETLLNSGTTGFKGRSFGSKREGWRARNSSHPWQIARFNKNFVESVGSPRNTANRFAKATSKEEHDALIKAYVDKRKKHGFCFQPCILGAYQVHVDLGKNFEASKPKWVAKSQMIKATIICSPRCSKYWHFYGMLHIQSNQILL